MEKQDEDYWKGALIGFGSMAGVVGAATTEIIKPELMNGIDSVLIVTFLIIICVFLGGMMDRWSSHKRKQREPKKFIHYLTENVRGEVRAVIIGDLNAKANECVDASLDSIQFQQEELNGTGRMALCFNKPEGVEEERERVNVRVSKSLAAFYNAYDTVAPFAVELGLGQERTFKAFATRRNKTT